MSEHETHPPPMPRRSKPSPRKLWERLTWPQVGALALTLAGLIGVAHTLPQSFWDRVDWETVGWFVMSLLGVGGSAAAGPLLRRDPESHERSGDE